MAEVCPTCGVPANVAKEYKARTDRDHRVQLRRDAAQRATELGMTEPGKIAKFVADQTGDNLETVRKYLRTKGYTASSRPGRTKRESIGK